MANEFIARNGVISKSNIVVSGSLTALSNIVAQTLVVQTITSSISSITGSTNFGSLSSNTHTFTGSINASGSGTFSGSVGIGLTPYNNTIGPAFDMKNGVGMFGYGDAAYISGNMYFDGAWKVKNAGTGSQITLGGEITFNTSNPTGSAGTNVTNTERMRITNAGLVGIGITNPIYSLDIASSNGSIFTPAARISTSTGGAGGATILQINHTANSVSGLQILQAGAAAGNYTSFTNTENGYMSFATSGSERMRVSNNGNVLIGTSTTTTATAGLDALIMGKSGAGSVAAVFTDGASTRWGFVYANASQVSYSSFGNIAFETGPTASEKMRIASAGQVTIPNQPSFYATSTAGSSTYSSGEVIVFNTTRHNIGSCYNTSTGRFTAPVAGRYLFMLNCYNYGNNTNSIVLTINGSQYAVTDVQPLMYTSNTGGASSGFALVWELAVNDYVEVRVRAGGSAQIYRAHSHFSGHLLG